MQNSEAKLKKIKERMTRLVEKHGLTLEEVQDFLQLGITEQANYIKHKRHLGKKALRNFAQIFYGRLKGGLLHKEQASLLGIRTDSSRKILSQGLSMLGLAKKRKAGGD